jgi:putative hydrolase of the HAD superfamily
MANGAGRVSGAPRFDAVVFDLFGTLVPEFSRAAFFQHVRAMGRELEIDEDAFRAAWEASAHERQTGGFATVAENLRACAAATGSPVDGGALERALEIREAVYRRWFYPRPGAVETLAELRARGYAIALISMCAPDAPALWRSSDLASFVDVEVFSSETGLRKPDPAIYRYATDRLGVDPVRCLYCGDGGNEELAGAEAVGMTAYLIREPGVDPAGLLTPGPDGWTRGVEDLRELLDLLPALDSARRG